ncbi:MAG: D-alanyl-D-alanine carboxypeptidase/D-alanyl-D-alanine-endopeptidase [Calditrichaeota bacterium]|nr:MAG: D-alanyl-D-alanine carboxypeptidase/D-alanyl-D-alanine-endopeptidase [Calditrichota bacterium]
MIKMKFRLFLPLLFGTVLFVQACSTSSTLVKDQVKSRPSSVQPIVGLPALQAEIKSILAHDAVADAFVGMKISRLRDGKVLYSQNENKLFHPASNMKLYTSAAALHYLGLDYKMVTRVAIDSGAVLADTLRSNLYLIGGGDPMFSIGDLDEILLSLANKGVKYIAGDIICDASFLDDMHVGDGWMWDDAGWWYTAPLSALSIQENCVEVLVSATDKLGEPAKVALVPATKYLQINNTSVTVDSATYFSELLDTTKVFDRFNVERHWQEEENVVDVSGYFGDWFAEDKTTVDVVDAPLYFGTLFKEGCHQRGIGVEGEVKHGSAGNSVQVFIAHDSKPLPQLLADMNKPSSNLCAELFLKIVGAVTTGKQGTAKAGIHALQQVLESWQIDTTKIRIADGSGMSRYTLISASSTHDLLRAMHENYSWRYEFIASLPIAGVDGSLKNRMRGSAAQAVVHAKTGTLSGVSSLAGYTTNQDGDELVFAIHMAHFVGSSKPFRLAQDKICDAITRYRE